jgi:hypothetical protein
VEERGPDWGAWDWQWLIGRRTRWPALPRGAASLRQDGIDVPRREEKARLYLRPAEYQGLRSVDMVAVSLMLAPKQAA